METRVKGKINVKKIAKVLLLLVKVLEIPLLLVIFVKFF